LDHDSIDVDATAFSQAPSESDAAPKLIWTRRGLFAPLLVLLPVLIVQAVTARENRPQPRRDATGLRAEEIRGTIDPNNAPWWELTALPQVGEVTAKRIVAYREAYVADWPSQLVFASAKDLEQVHGIGPKTVARFAPYLSFAEDGAISAASE